MSNDGVFQVFGELVDGADARGSQDSIIAHLARDKGWHSVKTNKSCVFSSLRRREAQVGGFGTRNECNLCLESITCGLAGAVQYSVAFASATDRRNVAISAGLVSFDNRIAWFPSNRPTPPMRRDWGMAGIAWGGRPWDWQQVKDPRQAT